MPIIDEKSPLPSQSTVVDPGLEFHFATRNTPYQMIERSKVIQEFEGAEAERKVYRSCERTPLLGNREPPFANFAQVMSERRSSRSLSGSAIELEKFSDLLKMANSAFTSRGPLHRTAPSAGGRYPIELYAVVNQVGGLRAGLYHYDPLAFALELLKDGKQALSAAFPADAAIVERSSVVFFLSAVVSRTTRKYGVRGWKLAILDAGHLGENLWLASTALGLGCVALGGGLDSEISRLLETEEATEPFMIAYAVGQKSDIRSDHHIAK